MAPVAYTGALQPKKKSELQEIAGALRLSDLGTKDEIQARIKKHLDANQDDLEDDPTFTGLFGRRKRSVQPQPIPHPPPSSRFALDSADSKPKSSSGRRSVATPLDPVIEASPAKDMRDISMFLKQPISPAVTTPAHSPRQIDVPTPSSLPPLPPSPTKSIIEHFPKAAEVKAVVQQQLQQQILQNGNDLLTALRSFLSNSLNVWSLASIGELIYLLWAIVPWKTLEIPVSSAARISIVYPPASIFRTAAFYHVLIHWAVPTLLLPTLLGCLISFNPALVGPAAQHNKDNDTPSSSTSPPDPATAVTMPLDPLTAAIVRLAGATAYPYAAVGAYLRIVHLDVLGSEWRVLAASVGLAFAFAEAIGSAPQVTARTITREQQLLLKQDGEDREVTPRRRALMSAEDAGSEVD